jgi:hypothetical protein
MAAIREMLMLGALASTVVAIPTLFVIGKYEESKGWRINGPSQVCAAGHFRDRFGTCRPALSRPAAGPEHATTPPPAPESDGNASSAGVWADPSTAEIAAADILSRFQNAPPDEPMKTGSLDPDDLAPNDGEGAGPPPGQGHPEDAAGQPDLAAPAANQESDPAMTADPPPEPLGPAAVDVPPDLAPPHEDVAQTKPETPVRAPDAALPIQPPASPNHVKEARLEPPSPPKGPAWVTATKEDESKALAESYLRAWSSRNEEAFAGLEGFFAPKVAYFGRSMELGALMRTKRRFAERWPVRNYRHRPGSMSVHCDEQSGRCTVRSIVDWEAANPARKAKSKGAWRFELGLDMSGARPMVRLENGQRIAGLSKQPASKAVPARAQPTKQEVKARSPRLPRSLLPDDILLDEAPDEVW